MEPNPLCEGDLDPAFWASFMYDIQRQDNNLNAPTFAPDMLEAQGSEPRSEGTANDDMRSLQIMICSRQDRIEASIAAIQTDLREMMNSTIQTHESLSRLESGSEVLRSMLEKLRRSMDVFAKTLYRLLSGNAGPSGESAAANPDFATRCGEM